jgi:hypothetical protein
VEKGPSLWTWSRQRGQFWVLSTTSYLILVFCLLPLKKKSRETRIFSKGSQIIHTAVTNLLAGGRVFDSRTVEIPIYAPQSPDRFWGWASVTSSVASSVTSKVWWFSGQVLHQKSGGSHTLCIERMGCIPGHSPVVRRLIQH